MGMYERLQKILSAHGVASRRASELLIKSGSVLVNGRPAELGDKADPELDVILVNGRPITRPRPVYVVLYKPRGVITTLKDGEGRKTVRDCLPRELGYLVPAGRLDLSSEGLLLMTNDGACVNALTHPSRRIEKTYLAWVQGDADAALRAVTSPIEIDGAMTRPAKARKVADGLLSITIREGKNRQVRRLCEYAGLHVTRLKRVSEGKLRIGDMKPGDWRYLTDAELEYIRTVKADH